jgi:hypothetical protein
MLKLVINIRLFDRDGKPVEGFDVDELTFKPTKKGSFSVGATKLLRRAVECVSTGGAATMQRSFEL